MGAHSIASDRSVNGIEKYPTRGYNNIPYTAKEDVPTLCCHDCRLAAGAIPHSVLLGQGYYCPLCQSEWCIPPKLEGFWAAQWKASIPIAVTTFVWMILFLATLIATIIGTGYLIVLWRIDAETQRWTFIGICAAAIAIWILGIHIIGQIYTCIINGAQWIYRYIRNEKITELW